MNQASIADAKNHFPRLVQQAEAGEKVCITRRGRPVAVLLSAEAYERLTSPKLGLSEFLSDWRKEMKEACVPFPEAEVFQSLRDKSPGREIDLA